LNAGGGGSVKSLMNRQTVELPDFRRKAAACMRSVKFSAACDRL